MKSIRSELSFLVSTAASRGWYRARVLAVETRRAGMLLTTGLVGVGTLGLRTGALSPAGPVDLMNSAKSDVDSRGTRASRALGLPTRTVEPASPGDERDTGPGPLLPLLSTALGLVGVFGC